MKVLNLQKIYDVSGIEAVLERDHLYNISKCIKNQSDLKNICMNRYRLLSEFDNKIFKSARSQFGQLYGFIRIRYPDSDILYTDSGKSGYQDPIDEKGVEDLKKMKKGKPIL